MPEISREPGEVESFQSEPLEEVMDEIIRQLGGTSVEPLPTQPPHRLYGVDGRYVIKATVADRPDELFERTSQRAEIIMRLRAHGAQVMEFALHPRLAGAAVITASPFYPERLPATVSGYHKFGGAIASLHNASQEMQEDFEAGAVLDPLPVIQRCLAYLKQRDQAGEPFAIGDTTFPHEALHPFEEHLASAQVAYAKMMQLAAKRNRLSMLALDVHAGNVLLGADGEPRIIDLADKMFVGPPEYDLARPAAHWVQRFGRDPRWREAFLEGYESKLRLGMNVDQDLLGLAIKVSDMYYATSMLKNAVEAHELGHPTDEQWRITEVVNRLTHLDNPDYRWKSSVDYAKGG